MLLLLLALQADAPEEVRDALRRTRIEKGYSTVFKGGGGPPGAWINKSGRGQRPAAGLILLEVQATGQKDPVHAVRVGNRTWAYSRVHQAWMAPDEAGVAGIAHGLVNPEDMLALIGDLAKHARRKGNDIELLVEGAAALNLAKKLAGDQGWTGADATIRLKRDGNGRLALVAVAASATSAQGKAKLEADVELTYGEIQVPERLGGVEFNADIKAAIADQLK